MPERVRSQAMLAAAAVFGDGCAVRGCDVAPSFTLTRCLPSDHHPRVVVLAYCVTHYGQANRFRRDRRAL